MAKYFTLRIFDVDHGACAMMVVNDNGNYGRLAMIDSGHNGWSGWRPSQYIVDVLEVDRVDYLFITNVDEDHISDLANLESEGISVSTLIRSKAASAAELRAIKENADGFVSEDCEQFLHMHTCYSAPSTEPFDEFMNGVTCVTFQNSLSDFVDTNNLSLVVFIKFGEFKILFPGDMEIAGWLKLLENPAFIKELVGTNILVASHHGRWSGFCEEIFDYFTPDAVVISDKYIVHDTQKGMAQIYGDYCSENGVVVTDVANTRYVLTTRKDGDIIFIVGVTGDYDIRFA
jgi:beta-lactamase superfamily II metal-dependent hydrolase